MTAVLRWCLVVGLGCLAAYLTWRYFRLRFHREERRALLRELLAERPDFVVLDERVDRIHVRDGLREEIVFRMRDFYAALMMTNRTPAVIAKVRRKFVAAMAEGRREVVRLTRAHDGKRVLPRLVTRAFLDAPARAALPRRELPGTGLVVVYCLDSEQTVRFLTKDDREELDLQGAALHALALANLAARGDMRKVVEAALASDAVNAVRFGDAFDAARVLLVPAVLGAGESLAAIVPDRDTLVLARAPGSASGGAPAKDAEPSAWDALVKLARASPSDGPLGLLDVPLVVDASGIRRYDAPA